MEQETHRVEIFPSEASLSNVACAFLCAAALMGELAMDRIGLSVVVCC